MVLEISHHVGPRLPPGGIKSEEQSAEHTENRRRQQHSPVRRGTENDVHRQTVERQQFLHRGGQQVVDPDRDHQASNAAEGRQQQSLGEQLAQDPSLPATNGGANGELLASRRAARQEHVGEIDARDQQHDPGHAEQQDEDERKLTIFIGRVGADRQTRDRAHDDRLVLVDGRKSLAHAGGEHAELRVGIFCRQARAQPTYEKERVVVAIGQLSVAIGERGICQEVVQAERQVNRRRQQRRATGEMTRGDTDDGQRLTVDDQRLANELRILARSSPVLVADDDDRHPAPRGLLGRREESATKRAHSESVEVVMRGELGKNAAGRLTLCNPDHGQVVGHQAGERGVLLADVLEVRIREAPKGVRASCVLAEQCHQLVRSLRLNGSQQESVRQREDRRVGTNSEPQNGHRHRCEAGVLHENTDGVAEILPDALQDDSSERSKGTASVDRSIGR